MDFMREHEDWKDCIVRMKDPVNKSLEIKDKSKPEPTKPSFFFR